MSEKQKKSPAVSFTEKHRASATKALAAALEPYKPFWGESLDAREDAERQSYRNACVSRGTHWPFTLG